MFLLHRTLDIRVFSFQKPLSPNFSELSSSVVKFEASSEGVIGFFFSKKGDAKICTSVISTKKSNFSSTLWYLKFLNILFIRKFFPFFRFQFLIVRNYCRFSIFIYILDKCFPRCWFSADDHTKIQYSIATLISVFSVKSFFFFLVFFL